MQDMTHEEILSLVRLMCKIELDIAESSISASDMEEFGEGLARLGNDGFMVLKLAEDSLKGKPFTLTSDNPKTIERCKSLAEYLGKSVDEVTFDGGLTRMIIGAPTISDSFKRFVLNDDGNIIDRLNRVPGVPACNCETCQEPDRTELHQQVHLRSYVLWTLLSVLSEKVDFLCKAEAHSLADMIYCTMCVSRLSWTIGHPAVQSSVEGAGDQSPNALADRTSLSPFLDDVEHLLRDLYSDCDQDLLNDLLESLQVIVDQWERARTASSRNFLERLSRRLNAPESSPSLAPSSTYSAPAADENVDRKTA
jgi:hypothetical protein